METRRGFRIRRIVGRQRDDAFDVAVEIQLRGVHRHVQNRFAIRRNRVLLDGCLGTSARRRHLIDLQIATPLIAYCIGEFDELLWSFA